MELEFPAFDTVNMVQSKEVLNWQVLCTSSVLSKNGNLPKLYCWHNLNKKMHEKNVIADVSINRKPRTGGKKLKDRSSTREEDL